MIPSDPAVVGIDVGGKRKGFHAVALRGKTFGTQRSAGPREIVDWCLKWEAVVVAVDAPCDWSQSSSSRLAERELARKGIHCFATPTRVRAVAHERGFYDWVFNGEKLYEHLKARGYPLFDGEVRKGPICFETFPHAIVCSLIGRVVPAKPKNSTRRKVLRNLGCDDSLLTNIDFVDAALCAVTAERFVNGLTVSFGTRDEGIIVVPSVDSDLR
jgi:predicted nuclease with RNAse H fold